jgi:signal transduction histidine kinase/CheY-like chemotaxis protein/GGDEF domain-containing protein
MEGKRQSKKKTSIFIIFLIPLIVIMLIQSMITIGTLVMRRTTGILEEYSGSMMNRLVENRRVILQNDMNQRWASVRDRETSMNRTLELFLNDEGVGITGLLESEELKDRLLEQLFPEAVDQLQGSSTTGIFLILTGGDRDEGADFSGFFIRDSDPDTRPENNTDLLLERGSKHLSRKWSIPLDTGWTTHFYMEGQGKNAADSYFYEPWRAGEAYGEADTEDLGYWSMPFSLGKGVEDSYEMITYSLPLRYEGTVYGVLGIEISARKLNDYFPVAELNESQQSGYMLAVRQVDGRYLPLVGKGMLYNLIRAGREGFALRETEYENLLRVEEILLEKQGVYAVVCPLKLYSNNVPYENTEWVLMGLDTEEDLFGISRKLYFWMVVAILIGLLFGVLGIYLLVRYLTRPVQRLMECISEGRAGLQHFKPSNILEVDALYDVVKDLTDRQKEAEEVLLEEKERYRVAVESTKDVFYSYDYETHLLNIVNHKTMNGQWPCGEFEGSFISPNYIYEEDREAAKEALRKKTDRVFAEFRIRWQENEEFVWVQLSGNAVYDTEGKRRKLVGSIREIQEQKEREAEQLRKNSMDGVTGLYAFSAGMKRLQECRRKGNVEDYDGVMINLFLDRLKESNEKNGIVFGDMILEEIGCLIRSSCQNYIEDTDRQAVALRLDGDDFVLWLEGGKREKAAEFTEDLLGRISAAFDEELFHVEIYAGLVCGNREQTTGKLICMARQARSHVKAGGSRAYLFYEEIPEAELGELPPLQGREINSLDYGEGVSLVSVALNLFGKGADFPAQMQLMTRKIGRYYQASDVLINVLQADFNSNYLQYQWHGSKAVTSGGVRRYNEEDKGSFCGWLGTEEARYVSQEDSGNKILQCFLNIEAGQQGIVLPMQDSGSYMGNICILGIGPDMLEDPEVYHDLAELGRVIQGQMNQKQHDIASKAKSEFLSRMSHEIRTPMNGIIGMTAIALQPDQSRERIEDCLQKIQSSSDYLLGLINDILDMSKIESGKMKLEPISFQLQKMLDTVEELIRPQAVAKEIEFEEHVSLAHKFFRADRMRISQVLINLLGNAVKFTPVGGKITLTVEERTETGEVFFAVSDTGTGIAREDQERVFRSFEQASDRNPAKQQGTGLGLSISSRLIQMMGSNIRLESELGKGSTFSFLIPLELGEDVEKEEQKEEIFFAGYHILVVEDNEINAEIAQCLLEERNFKVDCVHNGAEAVERIRTTAPGTYDVILMDILMPVMDGLEATRRIRSMEREDCHTIPIVAMSANAFDDDLKKSVECGMNGHLSKPVEVDKLYQTLNQVLHEQEKKGIQRQSLGSE